MHLKYEGKWKFVLLAPTMILALAIVAALMPDIGSHYYDVRVPQLEAAVRTPGRVDRNTRRRQRLDVPEHRAQRHLQLVGERGGGMAAAVLKDQDETKEASGPHVSRLSNSCHMVSCMAAMLCPCPITLKEAAPPMIRGF